MKLINVVVNLVIVSICSASINSSFNKYKILKKNNSELKQKINSVYFLSESFRNTCEGKGFDSLNTWQKVCRDLYGLDYIGWADAESFMEVSNPEKGKLFYGAWMNGEGIKEVYCRSTK